MNVPMCFRRNSKPEFVRVYVQSLHAVSYFFPEKIASGVHRDYDPVLGDDKQCVIWYGDLSEDDHLPVIRMVKPGETQESQTYVNRTLVFLYAGSYTTLLLRATYLVQGRSSMFVRMWRSSRIALPFLELLVPGYAGCRFCCCCAFR